MNQIIEEASGRGNRYQEEQLQMLEKLCNIDSGTKNIEGNKKIVEILDQVLKDIGAEVTHIKTPGYGSHIVARINEEDAEGKVVLAAHLDTVFEDGDALQHPFHIKDGYAYGLGSADCKGGVVTIAYALKILKDANLLPNKELAVVLNCDEEVGSPTGKKLFEQEVKNAEAVLSFEPGRKKNGILTSRYGVLEGTINVTGESAHACMDGGPGANAVLTLAHLIVDMANEEDEQLGIHFNVAPIRGGVSPSVVADEAAAKFWVTVASEEAYKQVENYVNDTLPKKGKITGCDISISLEGKFPPMERCEHNIELYERIRDVGALLNMDLPEEMSKSPADCNFYSAFGIPTVDGLGPYMYNIHTVREHIDVDSLRQRTQLVSVILALI